MCVVAFKEQNLSCVLVHHAQVDASTEVPLEGVTPCGQTRGRDTFSQQRPGGALSTMQLQSPTAHDAYELAAQARHFRDGLAVGAAHKNDGGTRTVATFDSTDVKGSTIFYKDVTCSYGYVFGAVSVVCKNDPTCEKADTKREFLRAMCYVHGSIH